MVTRDERPPGAQLCDEEVENPGVDGRNGSRRGESGYADLPCLLLNADERINGGGNEELTGARKGLIEQ